MVAVLGCKVQGCLTFLASSLVQVEPVLSVLKIVMNDSLNSLSDPFLYRYVQGRPAILIEVVGLHIILEQQLHHLAEDLHILIEHGHTVMHRPIAQPIYNENASVMQ